MSDPQTIKADGCGDCPFADWEYCVCQAASGLGGNQHGCLIGGAMGPWVPRPDWCPLPVTVEARGAED